MIRLLLFPILVVVLLVTGCSAGREGLDQVESVFEDGAMENTETQQETAIPLTPFSEADTELMEEGSEVEKEDLPSMPPSDSQPLGKAERVSIMETERQIKAELAATLGILVEEVKTKEAVAKIWPDLSLGCGARRAVLEPEPIAGYRIILTYQNQTFEYHSDQRGNFKLCPDAENQ